MTKNQNFSHFDLKSCLKLSCKTSSLFQNPLPTSLETGRDWCSGFERRSPQNQFTPSTSEVNLPSSALEVRRTT